jgi:hypothetical protein
MKAFLSSLAKMCEKRALSSASSEPVEVLTPGFS